MGKSFASSLLYDGYIIISIIDSVLFCPANGMPHSPADLSVNGRLVEIPRSRRALRETSPESAKCLFLVPPSCQIVNLIPVTY